MCLEIFCSTIFHVDSYFSIIVNIIHSNLLFYLVVETTQPDFVAQTSASAEMSVPHPPDTTTCESLSSDMYICSS